MNDLPRYPHLARIETPADLRRLPEAELPAVARELREYLIEAVASVRRPFRRGPGRGRTDRGAALRLTTRRTTGSSGTSATSAIRTRSSPAAAIASPRSRRRTAWRRSRAARKASTTPSASAIRPLRSRPRWAWRSPRSARATTRKIVAVIGDGAMTAGMAFEALQPRRRRRAGHAGGPQRQRHVDQRERRRADQDAGARDGQPPAQRLARSAPSARSQAASLLSAASSSAGKNTPRACSCPARCSRNSASTTPARSTATIIPQLLQSLRTVKNLHGPQLLHVITTKGKGYAPAEQAQIEYHAVGPFDPQAGVAKKAARPRPTYTDIFGDWLCDMAAADRRLLGDHAGDARRLRAWCVSRRNFRSAISTSAIAEQHAVTLAAGMACEGAKPVVAIYSTFLQRAYDQADPRRRAAESRRHCSRIDRAGVVGPDGATPCGQFRPDLPALHAEHAGRWRRPTRTNAADADHRLPARRPRRGALSARQRSRRRDRSRNWTRLPIGKARDAPARPRPRVARFGSHARAGARRSPPNSTRPWSTCASSSRWTKR